MKQFKNLILAGALVAGLAGFAVSCDKYGNDIDEIRNELNSLRTGQIASVESQLNSLQSVVNSLQSASSATSATISELQTKLNALQSDSNASAAEIEALKANIAALVSQISSLQGDSEASSKAIEALEAKLAALSGSLDDLAAGSADEIAKVKEQIENLQTSLNGLNDAIEAEKAKVAAKISEIEDSIKEIEDGYATKEELAAEKKALQDEFAAAKKDLEDKIAAVNDALKKAATKDELAAEKKALEDKLAALEADFAKKLAEINAALAKAATKDELAAAKKALQDQLDELKDKYEALEAGKATKEQVSALASEVAGIDSAVKALEQSAATMAEDIEALAERIEALEEAKAEFDTKIAAIEADVENLKATYATKDDLKDASDEAKKALETATNAIYNKINEILADIAAIQAKFDSYFTSEEVTAAIDEAIAAAVNAQGEAFVEAFKIRFDAEVALAKLVNEDALNSAVADIEEKIDNLDKAVAEAIAKAIEDNNAVVDGNIAESVASAVNDLKGLVSGRVTSVVLIPELYVNGIEAIGLNSYKYDVKEVTSTTEKEEVSFKLVDKKNVSIDLPLSATTIRYHVSPSQVSTKDIKAPSFVYETPTAITKAGEKVEILKIKDDDGYKVENGELSITVFKVDNAVIFDGSQEANNKITTVAVRVPIADKLLADGEGEAVVYSDYARLYEATVTPRIHAAIDEYQMGEDAKTGVVKVAEYVSGEDAGFHFAPTYDVLWNSVPDDMVAKQILYTTEYDLLDMVLGCNTEDDSEIAKEELAKNGIEFRFFVPEKPYIDRQYANQQKYAKVKDGHMLVATYPDGGEDYGNAVAVGKTPIIRVELVNTRAEEGDKIIDVRYFKIEWVNEVVKEESLTFDNFKNFEWTANCSNFIGVVEWDEFVTKVLAKLNDGKGMTYEQFVASYNLTPADASAWREAVSNATISVTKNFTAESGLKAEVIKKNQSVYKTARDLTTREEISGEGIFFCSDASMAAQANTIVWSLHEDNIGQVIDENGNLIVDNIVAEVTLPSTTGKSSLVFKFVLNVKTPKLAEVNGFFTANGWNKFENGKGTIANVYPVQYKTGVTGTVVYEYDFDALFTDNTVLKNLLPCGEWNIVFAEEQLEKVVYEGRKSVYSYFGNETDLHKLMAYNVTDPEDPKGPAKAAEFKFYEYGTLTAVDAWFEADENPLGEDGKAEKAATHKSVKTDIVLSLANNRAAEALLTYEDGNGGYIDDKLFKVEIWARLNEYNPYLVHSFDVRFVAPLHVNATSGENFIDFVAEYSTIDLSKALKMTDIWGYLVAKSNGNGAKEKIAADLYKYYVVDEPVWNIKDAKACFKVDETNGNTEIDNTITAEEAVSLSDHLGECLTLDGTTLKWHNESGVALTKQLKIYVPVTVTHKWGVTTQWVSILVNPAKN